jgi:hypothetical protein
MAERYYEEKHWIEDISLYFEQMGLTRMAGRVLGVLLISDPPEQSINDLCELLQSPADGWSLSASDCDCGPRCTRLPSAGSSCSKIGIQHSGNGCKKHTTCSP